MSSVLNILKQSCRGLRREELLKKAKVEEVKNPLPELKTLIEQGLVRIDKSPHPPRFKATNLAFK